MAGPSAKSGQELQDRQSHYEIDDIGSWMGAPEETAEAVEGLKWLTELDHLLVYSFTPPKAMRMFPVAAHRHFIVKNNRGENVYVANEYQGQKVACGNRSFSVDVLDQDMGKVFTIKTPANCGVCCGSLVPWVEVVNKEAILLGSVEQKCGTIQQNFMLRDKCGRSELRVRGPLFPLWCYKHPELSVLSRLGPLELGLIVKVGDERCCELEVLFSKNLDTEMKAVILAMGFIFEVRNFLPRSCVPNTEGMFGNNDANDETTE